MMALPAAIEGTWGKTFAARREDGEENGQDGPTSGNMRHGVRKDMV